MINAWKMKCPAITTIIPHGKEVIITKKQIDELFETYDHQADVIYNLYKLVIPDLDKVRKVHGFPRAGLKLCHYCARQFMEFDEKHHPDVMPGGIWLNNGFSSDKELDDWEVTAEGLPIEYKE